MASAGQDAFRLSFQIAPIFLSGGVASQIPGGILPLISITQALDFTTGILGGDSGSLTLDSYFANYQPMAGSTLIDNAIGNYPFANQAVAANAIISQPLFLPMQMICPVGASTGYLSKLSTMMALVATLKQHNESEGTYAVATPAYLYTDLIMTMMKDVTGGESKQVQLRYEIDFVKPLLTIQDAVQAQNNLMSKVTAGTAFDGQPAWSGEGSNVGSSISAQAPSVVPASSSSWGSSLSPVPYVAAPTSSYGSVPL